MQSLAYGGVAGPPVIVPIAPVSPTSWGGSGKLFPSECSLFWTSTGEVVLGWYLLKSPVGEVGELLRMSVYGLRKGLRIKAVTCGVSEEVVGLRSEEGEEGKHAAYSSKIVLKSAEPGSALNNASGVERLL
ncbi:hypothetical protein NDU88_004980 [Pleurodeles waltl]|uniref:Uncharacterized protein n=1 Tax=Pleurodeles waltl TaxID=8319 RepID=A0AAV7VKB8_PLEWA|nr:hypothetical protein NDU88_004980 [Pleurodeles waltl]